MRHIRYKILPDGLRVCEEQSVYVARQGGELARARKNPRLIDLFAGAGGLTLGFTRFFGHKFQLVWANDFDGAAARTYCENFDVECDCCDILKLLNGAGFRVPQVDMVIGEPPCHDFSPLNCN